MAECYNLPQDCNNLAIQQLPGLILPTGSLKRSSKTHQFLPLKQIINKDDNQDSPARNKPLMLTIPLAGKYCGSYRGWLILEDRNEEAFTNKINKDMLVLNPVSGEKFELPDVSTLPPYGTGGVPSWYPRSCSIEKVVLSCCPNPLEANSCLVLAIYNYGQIAYCKLGNREWRSIGFGHSSIDHEGYLDAVYCHDRFYVLHVTKKLFVCNFDGSDLCINELINSVPRTRNSSFKTLEHLYLVEAQGELLIVVRRKDGGDQPALTSQFLLYKLDSDSYYRDKHEKVNDYDWDKHQVGSLGDYALFLGPTQMQPFTLPESEASSLKGNCIYYTDQSVNAKGCKNKQIRYDAGVYNLETACFEQFRTTSSTKKMHMIWITPHGIV